MHKLLIKNNLEAEVGIEPTNFGCKTRASLRRMILENTMVDMDSVGGGHTFTAPLPAWLSKDALVVLGLMIHASELI